MAPDAEKNSSKGQAWFCTTGLPSDIVIEVDDMTFHLHRVLISIPSFFFSSSCSCSSRSTFRTDAS